MRLLSTQYNPTKQYSNPVTQLNSGSKVLLNAQQRVQFGHTHKPKAEADNHEKKVEGFWASLSQWFKEFFENLRENFKQIFGMETKEKAHKCGSGCSHDHHHHGHSHAHGHKH